MKTFKMVCLFAAAAFAGLNASAETNDGPVIGHGNSFNNDGAIFIGAVWQAGYIYPGIGNYGVALDMYTSSGLGFRFDWLMNYGISEGTGGYQFTLGPEYGYELTKNIMLAFSLRGGLNDYTTEFLDTSKLTELYSGKHGTFAERYLAKHGKDIGKTKKSSIAGLLLFGPSVTVKFDHIYATAMFDFGWTFEKKKSSFAKLWSITAGYTF